MRMNERMKKALSMVLCLCMLVQNAPVMAFAATADSLCEHHTAHSQEVCGYVAAVAGQPCTHVHDEACGYVQAVEEVLCACAETDENGALVHTEGCGYTAPVTGADCTHAHDEACGYVEAVEGSECTYTCEESHEEEPSEEPSDEAAPVCDCGTDDALIHATTCGVYVAPENPVCKCAEKCVGVNEWCDVCGFDYTQCGGTDTAVQYDGGAIDLSTLTETYLISDSGEYTFEGSGNYGIKVESGNPTIVLNNASITVGEGSAIDVASGSNATIFVLGDNTIGTTKTESWDAPCGGIFVAEGGTVNITSNGTDNILRAHGTLAAAIGGKYDYDNNESYNAGSINISNVTVYAYTNNFYASAIGAAGEGTCGTINITNAVVYVYGAGDKWTSAPGIGNAWSGLDWSDTIPIVIISDSEVHTFRYNPYSDYIGYLGDESGDTYATGSINCGDGGSVKNSTIYCYTGLDATTTDKVVKYGALGGLLKEDGTCEGEHSGGTQTCMGYKCANCGNWFGEKNDTHDWSNKDGICANGCELTCDHESYTEGVCDVCDYACTHTTEKDENKATCKHGDICDLCGTEYGNQDADNHTGTLGTPVPAEDGKHTATWSCCEATVTEEHTFENGKCTVCGAACTHSSFADGKCTACGIPVCTCTVRCGETVDTTCTVCSADPTACEVEETPVAATNNIDAAEMTAEELKAAVDAALAAGYTAITVNLAEDADMDMFTALRTALAESTVPDGSINLTISGVKKIPDEGFIDMLDYFENDDKNIAGDKLKSLTLTDVETIGEYAFSACTNLEAVNLPQVVTVGECAFNEWKKGTKLTSLNLPNATTIGDRAFAYSSLLTSVNLPKVTSIGEIAFGYCDLRTLDLPEVTTIDGEAFYNNENLVSCSAPKATTIGYYPWGNCSKLETLELTAAGDITISNNYFANTLTGQINLVLNKDKESQVTQNDDGTATWNIKDGYGNFYTFKSITFVYSIEVSAIENGAVTADKSTATEGETVTLTVTAAEGYILDTLTVMNGGTPVEVTGNSFTMPAGDVTVSATFKACDHSGGANTAVTDRGNGTHGYDCTVCGTSVTEPHSIGADGKCVCGLAFWTVEGNTLTIDGTLGGKTEATEADMEELASFLESSINKGKTSFIVTGENQAIYAYTAESRYPVVGFAIAQMPYDHNGTIDVIYRDATELLKEELAVCCSLRTVALPNVSNCGDDAFSDCYYLENLEFGSVVTSVGEDAFHDVDRYVDGGCELVLNCGQMQTESYKPNLDTSEWAGHTWKSITLTHTPVADDGDCTTAVMCSACGEIAVEAKESHTTELAENKATCQNKAKCDLCGTEYGELGGHSFDSAGICTGCQIKAKAKLETYDSELGKYVPTYYATLPEALAAVTQPTSQVEALADYDGVLELTIDFDGNGYTFSGEITVDEYATIQDGNFTGKVILNYGNIWDGTFQGEVIVKADGYIQGGTFHNTVTVETGGEIMGMDSTFKGTVINNGSIYAGNFYSDVTNNGKIYRDALDVSVFYGTLTNNGTIYGGYFSGGKLINAGTVENHCSDSYDYEDGFEYVPAEGGTVTGDHNNTTEANCTSGAICSFCGEYGDKNPNNHASDIYTYTDNGDGTHGKVCTECGNVVASEPHTLTYTASGNVITATCSANCGYSETATISAENATYNGTEQTTASIAYSEGWTGGEPTVSYENNVNAGTATASITLGEATASVEFTIAKAEINIDDLVDPEFAANLVYDGTKKALVTAHGSVPGGTILYSLTYDGEYTSTIPVATEAGRYGVYWLIQGDENHEDILSPGWTQVIIAAKPGTDANVTLGEYDSVYSGTAKEPGIASVVVDGVTLTAGKDYDVSYENNVYAGTAKAVITFKGNYSGTVTETFQISKAPLTVTADDKSMTTGRDLPAFTYTITGFVNGETEAVLTTKPTVSCEADGQTAGTYDITVSGAEAANYDISYVKGILSVVDHQHAWTYTADGDTITAKCGNADTCSDPEQTIKIAAEGKTYDGTPVTATLDGSIDDVANPAITYFRDGEELNESAIKPGTYTASITMGAATASVEFTITIPEAVLSPATPNGEYGWYKSASLLAPDGYAISTIQDGTFGAKLDLSEGTHESITYWLTYEANRDCEPVSLTWTGSIKIDGTAPTVSGSAESVTDSTATITVSADDKGSGVASTSLICTDSSVTIGALENGAFPVSGMQPNTSYTFTLTVKDAAGNEASATVKLTTEKGASSVTKAPTANKLTYTGEAQALITAGEASGGEMQYSLDGQNWSAEIPTGTDVDTYTVYYKVVGDSNHYDTEADSIQVKIGKADPNIGTVSYSGATLYDSTSISTVVLSRSVEAIPGTLELTDTGLTAGEGTYSWKFTPNDISNYNTITGTVVLNVTADVLKTIKASGTLEKSSYTYGDSFSIDGLTVTATYTSGATKDVTGFVSFDENLAVGQTSVELTYQGQTCEVTGITVAKKQLVISGMSWDVPEGAVYSGTAYTATLNGTLPEGVTVTKTGDTATNAGNYTAKAVFSLADGYSADNYEIVNGEALTAAWSIAKAKATITVNTSAITVTYGETVSLPTATTNFGTVTCDKTVADLVNAGNYTVTYTVVGTTNFDGDSKSITVTVNRKAIAEADVALNGSLTYTGKEQTQEVTVTEGITYEISGNKGTAVGAYELTVKGTGNYTGEVKLKWSIKEALAVVGTAPTAKSLTYTGEAQVLVNAGTTADGKLVYSLTENGEYTENIPSGINAGDYTVWYYVVGDDNHADSAKVSVKVTIAKAKATITVDTTTINVTYGESVTLPTATTNFGTVTCNKAAADLVNAGTYIVTYTVEGTDNYDGDTKTLTVIVNQKEVAEPTITGTYTYTGNEQTVNLTGVESYMTVVSGNKGTDAGSYEVVITLDGNHKWADGSDGKVQWSIAKAQAEINVNTDPITVTYGETVTLPTATTNFGAAVCDKTAADLVNAGTYTVTYSVAGTNNYEGAEKKLTVTVEKKAVAEPAVTGTYTYTGEEQTVTLTGVESYMTVVSGNKGINADSYEVVITLDDNHKWADGSDGKVQWSIAKAKAEITVDTDAITVTYGETVTLPTATTNFGAVTCDKTVADLVNAGTYTVTYSVAGTDNYDGDTKSIIVNVNAKAITADDVKLNGYLTYNGKEQTQPITVTAGITYEVTGNKNTNAGEYELTVKGTGNYTGSVNVKWSIAKAAVTITADNKVFYVGAGLPTLTYTVSGLIAGDELAKVPTLNTNANAAIAGTYEITVANANAGSNYEISYVSGTLTVINAETEVETKIEQTELTEVPAGLKDTPFNTVEAITEELISRILAVSTGFAEEEMVHYDVTLQFSLDDGETWIHATEENFPTEGITVILPYPEGTNARDYEFVVSHMFTVTSQRLGTVAGDVELPKVEETANGIRVTLNGLSPVTVAAKYHDHTGGTATCTEKAVCTICGNAYGEVDKTNHAGGTEVKDAKEATCGAEGYTGDTYCKGCNEIAEKGTTIKATGEHTYGDWKVVKEPTKTQKGEKQRTCTVCGHVDSKEIPVLSDTPATGDDSNIMLYGSMFTMSLAALVVLLLASKKRKQAS